MKSMKFATGGDEAKVAAFGGALAESVLDDASAEERDDSGGDESDDGKPNEEDDSSEVEGAPETSFEAKYEAILQLIFGSFNPIARSKSTKEDGDDFDEDYWSKMSIPDAAMHFLTRMQHLGDGRYKDGLEAAKETSIEQVIKKDSRGINNIGKVLAQGTDGTKTPSKKKKKGNAKGKSSGEDKGPRMCPEGFQPFDFKDINGKITPAQMLRHEMGARQRTLRSQESTGS